MSTAGERGRSVFIAEVERSGLRVFYMRLPLELAPSMNVYAGMKPWSRAKLRTDIDAAILLQLPKWPNFKAGFTEIAEVVNDRLVKGKVVKGGLRIKRIGGRQRLAIVRRHSSRQVDELSCDVLGAKAPLDRLVQAGVLVDDNAKWLQRCAIWVPAKPKEGHLTIEVYEGDSP